MNALLFNTFPNVLPTVLEYSIYTLKNGQIKPKYCGHICLCDSSIYLEVLSKS